MQVYAQIMHGIIGFLHALEQWIARHKAELHHSCPQATRYCNCRPIASCNSSTCHSSGSRPSMLASGSIVAGSAILYSSLYAGRDSALRYELLEHGWRSSPCPVRSV